MTQIHETKYTVELTQDEIYRIAAGMARAADTYGEKFSLAAKSSRRVAAKFWDLSVSLAAGANVASECYRIIEEVGGLPTYTIENNS